MNGQILGILWQLLQTIPGYAYAMVILFIKNGEVVDKSVGAVPKAVLAEKLDALM